MHLTNKTLATLLQAALLHCEKPGCGRQHLERGHVAFRIFAEVEGAPEGEFFATKKQVPALLSALRIEAVIMPLRQ